MATQFADTGATEEVDTTAAPAEQANEQPENEILDPETFYGNENEAEPSDEELDELDADGEDLDPIAPPTSWNAEDKADWDELPRKQQEIIARREAERDKHLLSKAREATEAEKRVQQQAHAELAKIYENSAQELERYASMFLPQPPDPRLLYTGNPQDALTYQQQDVAYKQASAQQQQLQQEARQRAAEAQRIQEQQVLAQRQADAARLQEALPDWFDVDKAPKLHAELQSIGATLGYPVELMAEATADDILALKQAAEWKAKADKFDKWMSRKMSAVARAKKLPPKFARPGAAAAQQGSTDPVKLLYPDD
ncbi:hypothetical protein [Sphingobium sp. B1D7B]|uniref:hypothetical protein n=1 Tax=Sphingobium sp. B1D7B TaxID=2940578 RepID=UPI0022256ABD|nr:hypothetical protein [Sphingobium sp. B1D7B]